MRKITRVYLEKFLARYATDERILDVGSGGSRYSAFFPNRVTLDIDPERGPDVIGSAEALPFPDAHFNFILCTEVLEHVEHPEQAIGEMQRVLAPGGRLLLTTRFAFPVHDAPGDYWRFTPYAMKRLFAAWDIECLETDGGPFTAIAIILQRIALQCDVRGGKLTKAVLYAGAWLCSKLDGLVVRAYGDIQRSQEEAILLSSGLFVLARKR